MVWINKKVVVFYCFFIDLMLSYFIMIGSNKVLFICFKFVVYFDVSDGLDG